MLKVADIAELKDGLNECILDAHKFFIYKKGSNIRVYDSICPHQGGTLHREGDEIYCKVHHWRFDSHSGEALNIKNTRLFEYETYLDDQGVVYISYHLPSSSFDTLPPPLIHP